jgi:hypothetical protein
MTDDGQSLGYRQLYEMVKGDSSITYSAFVRKMHRLETGNVRTVNALKRKMDLEIKKKPVKREFLAFDGEGFDDKYVLLANSLDERISNPDGLTSKECLDFLSTGYSLPVIRVFFSFGYDVNHILRDVPDDLLLKLMQGNSIVWEGYRIQYIPGKIFSVNNYKFFDVFSFFQTSFINVVRRMLGEDAVTENLTAGKAARGSFDTWNMDDLVKYNDEELALLVQILNKLRDAFENIDVHLTEWYGPGAVAKVWFAAHKIKVAEKHAKGSLHALDCAYFGGRFEQLSLGKFQNAYEYDIHSAYPAVMSTMPNFTKWNRVTQFEDHPYSIWHVSFDLRADVISKNERTFLPLPMRGKDGRISFPMVGKGWYWYSEVKVLLDYFPNARITIREGYIADTEGSPFAWVAELYDYRRELKDSGDLSQYAIKVGLNSLYGKCAQRVGRNTYFSLSWAGYITSSTRAKLARAGYENGADNIIGFATDALFSTKPLKLPLSDDLGDWEASSFDSATFFQSGVYRMESGGKIEDRYRGSPLRHGIDDIIQQLTEHPNNLPSVRVGRFISHLLAIKAPNAYGPYRLQFVQTKHTLQIDAPYKRHYTGFDIKIKNGNVVTNYGRILTEPIASIPKVWIEDNSIFDHSAYLHGRRFNNVESSPPPIRDMQLQRMLDDAGVISSHDGLYDDVADLLMLPILEDQSM